MQAIYLGAAVEVFVTSDRNMLLAISEINGVLRYPRCVIETSDFLSGVSRKVLEPGAPASQFIVCPVCGCAIPTSQGVHFSSFGNGPSVP